MTKNKHPGKNEQKKPESGISFSLEENAEELFLQALDKIDPGKKNENPPKSALKISKEKVIDLHRMTLEQAKNSIDSVMANFLHSTPERMRIKIITGKGIHSKSNSGVLAREIHRYLIEKYNNHLVKIDDSPAMVVFDELPMRGFFNVILTKITHR